MLKENPYIVDGKLKITNDEIREELIKYRESGGVVSDNLLLIISAMIDKLKNWRFRYKNIEDQEDCVQDAYCYILEKLYAIPVEKYTPDGQEIKVFNWFTQMICTGFVLSWRRLHPKGVEFVNIDVSGIFEI
jgi:hypothetical protein